MKWLTRLLSRNRKRRRGEEKMKVFHQVENKVLPILAFEQGGHKYYQFENVFDTTAGRGIHALVVYEEFQMRCDREYLLKHVKAIDILFNQNPIKLTEIIEIHKNLKERLDLAPFPDYIYKLASILFFDETENPYNYDYKYNQEKIARWKADDDMLPFLVKVPLKSLMSFSESAQPNLKTYFSVAQMVNDLHLEKISLALSKLQ